MQGIQNQRRRFYRLRALLLLFGIVMVLRWAVPTVHRAVTPLLVRTAQAETGVLEISVKTTALVLREERVYRSPIPGTVTILTREGKRVPAGTVVCEVIPFPLAPVKGELDRSYEQVRLEIEELRARIYQLEEHIQTLEAQKAAMLGEGKPDQAETIFGNILTSRRELHNCRARLSHLEEMHESTASCLHPRTQARPEVMRTQEAGVVRLWSDGWEDILVKESVFNIRDVSSLNIGPAERIITDGQRVATGDPLFRVVDDHWYHFFVRLPLDMVPFLQKAGNSLYIRILDPAEAMLRARLVEYRSDDTGIGVLMLLSQSLPFLDDKRKLATEVILARHSGTIVPTTAVVKRNGKQGIWVQTRGGRLFVPVVPKGSFRGRACVSELPAGTRVVINPGVIPGNQ